MQEQAEDARYVYSTYATATAREFPVCMYTYACVRSRVTVRRADHVCRPIRRVNQGILPAEVAGDLAFPPSVVAKLTVQDAIPTQWHESS